MGREPRGQDVLARAIRIRICPDRIHLVDPIGGNDDIAGMKLGIDAAGDSAKDNGIDMKAIDDQLRIHGRVDHALPGQSKDEVMPSEIDFIEPGTVDRGRLHGRSRWNHLGLDLKHLRLERGKNRDALRFRGQNGKAGEKQAAEKAG